MDCKKAEKSLVEYLYQELSAKKVVELERHLEVCDRCSSTLESWRTIHQSYRRTAEEEMHASPFLKQKIMLAAQEELSRKPSFVEHFGVFLKPAVLLPLAIFVVATLLFLPWRSDHPAVEAKKVAPRPFGQSQNENKILEQDKKIAGLRDRAKTPAEPKQADEIGRLGREESEKQKEEYAAPMSRYSLDAERRQNQPAATEAPPPPPSSAPEPPPAAPAEAQPSGNSGQLSGGAVVPQQEMAQQNLQQSAEGPIVASKSTTAAAGEAYFREAQMSFQKDDLKDGLKKTQQAVQNDQDKTLAVQFHKAGIQYQQQRECEKAILQFVPVVNNYRNYPNLENVLLRLGDCYTEIGQVENARKTYQQLLQFPASRQIATQKLQILDKKIQSQEELKALGYTDQKQKQ